MSARSWYRASNTGDIAVADGRASTSGSSIPRTLVRSMGARPARGISGGGVRGAAVLLDCPRHHRGDHVTPGVPPPPPPPAVAVFDSAADTSLATLPQSVPGDSGKLWDPSIRPIFYGAASPPPTRPSARHFRRLGNPFW